MGSEIRYPQELLAVRDTVRYPVAEFAPSVKLLLYYHHTECSHCRLAHLTDYRRFFEIAGRQPSQFRILPVFAPEASGYEELVALASSAQLPDTVYVDRDGRLLELNPAMRQPKFHTLLLDRNDRVVLVGDPLSSDGLWDLYLATLDNLLAHDGLYVAEQRDRHSAVSIRTSGGTLHEVPPLVRISPSAAT